MTDYGMKFSIRNYIFSFILWDDLPRMYIFDVIREKVLQRKGYLRLLLIIGRFQFTVHHDTPLTKILHETTHFGIQFWSSRDFMSEVKE